MVTLPQYAEYVKRLYTKAVVAKLSRPTVETLAIVAYRQPLTRQEIEFIRGVNTEGVLKSLLEKDLVRIVGRKEAPGRPILYGTTRKFLEHFGLRSLEDLPKVEELNLAEHDAMPTTQAQAQENAQPVPTQENAAGQHLTNDAAPSS